MPAETRAGCSRGARPANKACYSLGVTLSRAIAVDGAITNGGPVGVARFAAECVRSRRTPVTHTYAALALYTGGSARVELNGAWSLRKGEILLIPAGEPHRMLETKGGEAWGLSFCVPCLGADGAASLLAPFERVRDGGAPVVRVPANRHVYLEGLFRELERVVHDRGAPSEAIDAIERSLLTLILAEVDKASAEEAIPRRAGGGVVVDALRFIERNCLRRLTLGDVAAAVGRTPAYVTTALTRATGRSAVSWIVSGRMAEARRLLLHSDEQVGVVAERVGYADPTHFIRMFRREHGVTPAAWRTAHAVGTAPSGRAEPSRAWPGRRLTSSCTPR